MKVLQSLILVIGMVVITKSQRKDRTIIPGFAYPIFPIFAQRSNFMDKIEQINQEHINFLNKIINNNQKRVLLNEENVTEQMQNQNVNNELRKNEQAVTVQGVQNQEYMVVFRDVNMNDPKQKQLNEQYEGGKMNDEVEVDLVETEQPAQQNVTILPQTLLDPVSLSVTGFGVELLKAVDTMEKGNVVVSPYSIATVLALMQQAAVGAAQQQISEALQMSPQQAREAFNHLITSIQQRITRSVFKVASNLFVGNTFILNPNFKSGSIRNFGSDVSLMNFKNPRLAASQVNSWVALKTQNRITDLVPPETLSEDTQILLVNAIFFKGIWRDKFKPEATIDRDFHLQNGDTKRTPFMRIKSYFPSGVDKINNLYFLIMPFESQQYVMMILLPTPDTQLSDVLKEMTAYQLATYIAAKPREVQVEIPKFTTKADLDLIPVLNKLGIRDIFKEQGSLFLVGTNRGVPPVVTDALHSAVLAIDEQGGTAAAATAFSAVALSADNTFRFKADRPFLAVLWDTQLNIPLFMAKIQEPVL